MTLSHSTANAVSADERSAWLEASHARIAAMSADQIEAAFGTAGDNIIPFAKFGVVKVTPQGEVEIQEQDETVEEAGEEVSASAVEVLAGEPSEEAEYAETADAGGDDFDPCTADEWNHADILGDAPEGFAEFLRQPATFLIGEMWGAKDRRNTQDGDWKAVTQRWGDWIEGAPAKKGKAEWGLSRHPENNTKEGASIVLGSSIEGARKAYAMDTMYALGLDIDSGAQLDDVIKTILAKNLFALIYTSHSHGKSGLEIKRDEVMRKLALKDEPTLPQVQEYLRMHSKSRYEESFIAQVRIDDPKLQTAQGVKIALKTPPLDKFRILFPLAEAVKLIDLAPTQAAALEVWEDKITGMAWEALGVHFDTSCTDPSRLFYTARHAKEAEWDCLILRGDPLKFDDVPVYKKHQYTKHRAKLNRFEIAGGDDEKKVPQCYTPSGRSLNDWHSGLGGAKDRFQIATLLETECPDKIRVAGGEAEGHVHHECPWEHEHSSEGGTATMSINALDAQTDYWASFCRHDSCQGRHKLQFLEEMLHQGWFEEDVLYDEDGLYLLPPGEEGPAKRQDGNSADAVDGEFEPVESWLPDAYLVRGGMILKRGQEGETPVPICNAFDVVGRSSNADGTEGAGLILSFVNENGVRVEVTISRADIMADGLAVVRMLADRGMKIWGRGTKANDRLLDFLNALTPSRRIPTVDVPGWVRDEHGDIVGFMHPTGVYDRVSGHPCRLLEGSRVEVTKPKGTLAGWTAGAVEVLKYADTNFYWPLGMVAAFGGPLLGILDWDPVGFSFSGLTSKGKTMAQILGTTVWTTPKAGMGLLFGGSATKNAFEDRAIRGTDTFLAVDEIGAMTDREALGEILMALSTGRTKDRKSGRGIGMQKGVSFRPFAILTSEHGLRNEVKATGKAYRGGLTPRFPDIDVSEGVEVSAEDRAKIEVLRDNYGHAGPVYVSYLIRSGIAADADTLKASVDAIAAKHATGKGSALLRTARVFAVAQRGGEIAADAGLLGDAEEAKKAIRTAVQRAWGIFLQSDEAGAASAGESVLDAFRSFLQQAWDRKIISAGTLAKDKVTGEAVPVGEAEAAQARGTPIGWYDADYIYLDWAQIEDPGKLGLDIGKRAELVKALGKAVERKTEQEAPRTRLPAHVAQAASGDGRAVKNLKLSRKELDM